MTSGAEEMTTRELLELASLDSLGLLDDVESAIYTRSFLNATATVQDEVVRLQAEVSGDLTMLPEEDPEGKLRERVLRAVADAIAREESRLAPLARIGRHRRSTDSEGRRMLASGQFWRAACFALAGTTAIAAYFFADAYHTSNELFQYVFNDRAQRLEILQPQPIDFLLDDSHKIALKAVDENAAYRGAVFLNEESRQAMLLVNDLPPSDDKEYVVQVMLKEGGTERLKAFRCPVGFGGLRLDDIPAEVIAGAFKWQVVLDGAILLSSV